MIAKRQNKGFTLIELLLGLIIFALISLSVYSVFSGGLRLNNRTSDHNMVYREANMAFDLMTNDLENMVGYNFSRSYPDKFAFNGNNKFIEFLVPTGEGLKVIRYYLITPQRDSVFETIIGQRYKKNVDVVTSRISTETVNYLVREEQAFVDSLDQTITQTANIEIIATNVRGDSLRFTFGYNEGEEEEIISWKETWQQNYVPLAVRVEMQFITNNEVNPYKLYSRNIVNPTGSWGKSSEEDT